MNERIENAVGANDKVKAPLAFPGITGNRPQQRRRVVTPRVSNHFPRAANPSFPFSAAADPSFPSSAAADPSFPFSAASSSSVATVSASLLAFHIALTRALQAGQAFVFT